MKQKPIVEDGIIAGNVYDKYGTKNPLARVLVSRFLDSVRDLVSRVQPSSIHEVGCGEGNLTRMLCSFDATMRASDFSREVIAVARSGLTDLGDQVEWNIASIYDLDPAVDAANLVVCCEVLEHLEQPERALQVLSALARPWLLVSVPREPLWRGLNLLRGKYLGQLGNTPGHLNHWSTRGFTDFLATRFDLVELRTPLPWTIALCRTKE